MEIEQALQINCWNPALEFNNEAKDAKPKRALFEDLRFWLQGFGVKPRSPKRIQTLSARSPQTLSRKPYLWPKRPPFQVS